MSVGILNVIIRGFNFDTDTASAMIIDAFVTDNMDPPSVGSIITDNVYTSVRVNFDAPGLHINQGKLYASSIYSHACVFYFFACI